MSHVIQLINGFAIIVDDKQFNRCKRQFTSIFHFSKFLTVVDIHGHKITVPKCHILMLEHYNEKIKTQKVH